VEEQIITISGPKIVGDSRWSYDGMLPYFRKTESHHVPESADLKQHGISGPIHTTSASRSYPLENAMRTALAKGTGLPMIKDANSGNPIGIAPYTENWRDGKRQLAGIAYSLRVVEVVTSSLVRSVILGGNRATGAELVDRKILTAKRKVIICCRAIRTLQLLMFSSNGPAKELHKYSIGQVVDSP
jgi:choline dehydrogenase-like flavoprotein